MSSDVAGLIILAACFVLGVRSTLRLRAIHKNETPPRNQITGAFYFVSLVITMAAGYFGFLSARRALGYDAIPGTPFVSLLIASLVLLIPVVLDMTVQRIRTSVETHAKFEAQGDRLEVAVAENTRVSQEALDHADAAYAEANTINAKLAGQADALIQQGEDRAERER
jgi:hypothetical protein